MTSRNVLSKLKIFFQNYFKTWNFQVGAEHESGIPVGFSGQGVLNKNPSVWLDGARPAPKSIGKNSGKACREQTLQLTTKFD